MGLGCYFRRSVEGMPGFRCISVARIHGVSVEIASLRPSGVATVLTLERLAASSGVARLSNAPYFSFLLFHCG